VAWRARVDGLKPVFRTGCPVPRPVMPPQQQRCHEHAQREDHQKKKLPSVCASPGLQWVSSRHTFVFQHRDDSWKSSRGNASVEGCQEGSHRSGQGFQGIASFQYREDRLLPAACPSSSPSPRTLPRSPSSHRADIAVASKPAEITHGSGCDDREDVLDPAATARCTCHCRTTQRPAVVPRKARPGPDPISSPRRFPDRRGTVDER